MSFLRKAELPSRVIVQILGFAIAVVALVFSALSYRRTGEVFELQRRPWVKVEVESLRGTVLFSADAGETARGVRGKYRVVNIGQGEACFPRMHTRLAEDNSRDTSSLLWSRPTMMVAPHDSTLWRAFDDTLVRADRGPLYLHVLCDYTSAGSNRTYRMEQIYFMTQDLKFGPDDVYLGEVRGNKLVWRR